MQPSLVCNEKRRPQSSRLKDIYAGVYCNQMTTETWKCDSLEKKYIFKWLKHKVNVLHCCWQITYTQLWTWHYKYKLGIHVHSFCWTMCDPTWINERSTATRCLKIITKMWTKTWLEIHIWEFTVISRKKLYQIKWANVRSLDTTHIII